MFGQRVRSRAPHALPDQALFVACTGAISNEDYLKLVDEAAQFLKGRSVDLRRQAHWDMPRSGGEHQFERAAHCAIASTRWRPCARQASIRRRSKRTSSPIRIAGAGNRACRCSSSAPRGWNRACFPRHGRRGERSGDSRGVPVAQFCPTTVCRPASSSSATRMKTTHARKPCH